MRRWLVRMFGLLAFGCLTGMVLAADPVLAKPVPPVDWLMVPQTGITLPEGSKVLPLLDSGPDKVGGLGSGTLSVGAEILWLQPTGGAAAFSQPHVGTSLQWQGGTGRGIGFPAT